MRTITPTTKKYSVIFECCDPPIPVRILNTDNLKRAKQLFDTLKQIEIDEGGGGEFTLTLYEHPETGASFKHVFKCPLPDYFDGDESNHIYCVIYNSKELQFFNYGMMPSYK